jgi:hypothetical protein
MNKLYIITTSDLPNNVILGHATFAEESGFIPVFVFPNRGNKDKYNDIYLKYECIKLKSNFNVKNIITYILSLFNFSYWITKKLFFKKNVKFILAIDLECTLCCSLFFFRNTKVITLVNDNFSIRYNFNIIIIQILKIIEALTYKFVSDYCIFPDQTRVDLLGFFKPKNVIIIENVLKNTFDYPIYKGSKNKGLTILICGWLDSTRGMELLRDLVTNTNQNIYFELVGSGSFIEENIDIINHDRINYHGHKSREETLDIMSNVDLNMAYYNPNILINRYALPQKISDSILISCPCIINSEVLLSKKMKIAGVAIVTPYFDTKMLSSILNLLSENKSNLKIMSEKMKDYSYTVISFEKVQTKAINFYKIVNN